jgi:redox-sensing transcriptional repressor
VCAHSSVRRGIPDATVSRLPGYLRVLVSFADRGVPSVSSEELADAAQVRPTQLRKDLSLLGSAGVRGVGYDVAQLLAEISAALGMADDRGVVIVGMGNLGRALAAYEGLRSGGFAVRALVDSDPALAGQRIAGLEVTPLTGLGQVVAARDIRIGVIATPADGAQEVCDRLVEAGIGSILSFAAATLRAPTEVDIRRVDLATELHVLAFRSRQDIRPASPDVRPAEVC